MDSLNLWNEAAKNGRLDIIYNLHLSNYPGCTTDTMDYAALGGHIDIFHFLFIYRTEGCSEKAFYWALGSGQIEMIKTLYLFFPEKIDIQKCITIAKLYSRLDIVEYLNLYINKCVLCSNTTSITSWSSVKNTCNKCYYTKFQHIKPRITIPHKKSSIVKKRCKNCLNYLKSL